MILTHELDVVWKFDVNQVLNRALLRMKRDLEMTLDRTSKEKKLLVIDYDVNIPIESYYIHITDESMSIHASDELGVIYALLKISEAFLDITPFWFWNDQYFEKRASIDIPNGTYTSDQYKFRYRGWFINDEVLLDTWKETTTCPVTGINENQGFEMAMETLLRLGGNLVIPGTDHNSHRYKMLAEVMGLHITHHHAEPLGATMFSRAYPELEPSYDLYSDLFDHLWIKAIKEQKDSKVIWNLGFRGQGDRPFWADEPKYNTPEIRGARISQIIQKQYDMIAREVNQPICCTNLYGEMMVLYQKGFLKLPEDLIYIWADNGYGKMVSRRQDNDNPRVEALPSRPEGAHGIYYHASFYDLQAAAHMTLLPNSPEFVENELKQAVEMGVSELLIVNCSNVKPHTYMLDHIASFWGKRQKTYVERYFPNCSKWIHRLYETYFSAMIQIGIHDDEHAGEQFYHYTIRAICHRWLLGVYGEEEKTLTWLTGPKPLKKQVTIIHELVKEAFPKMEKLHRDYKQTLKALSMLSNVQQQEIQLIKDSIGLQIIIHYESLRALDLVCQAYKAMAWSNYEVAFIEIGEATQQIDIILEAMNDSEHGKWAGFYSNECLTDMKFTNHVLKKLMGHIRQVGDGPHCYKWALKYQNPDSKTQVVLITNMRNHLDDWELYQLMKVNQSIL